MLPSMYTLVYVYHWVKKCNSCCAVLLLYSSAHCIAMTTVPAFITMLKAAVSLVPSPLWLPFYGDRKGGLVFKVQNEGICDVTSRHITQHTSMTAIAPPPNRMADPAMGTGGCFSFVTVTWSPIFGGTLESNAKGRTFLESVVVVAHSWGISTIKAGLFDGIIHKI